MTTGLTFTSLPDRVRRPLSLGFAALLLASATGSCAAVLSGYWERAESVDALTDDIARLETILDQGARTRPSSADSRDDEAPDILAKDPETAFALVQSRLRHLGAGSGTAAVHVESIRALPPQIGGTLTAFRAAIKLKVPASQVGRIINTLEAAVPSLLLDEVQIGPAQGLGTGEQNSSTGDAMTLIVATRMYVSGGRSPDPARPSVEPREPTPDVMP